MDAELQFELDNIFCESLQAPYFGGMRKWAEGNIELPQAYAIPGKLDLSISPYLLDPIKDIDDPNIMQINLSMATQVGKSLIAELAIPYWVINAPGPIMRIFHNNEISATFAETRLIPLLKNCSAIQPLLSKDRFATKKAGITLPHMAITMGGANEGKSHGMSIKYLLCDELHQWDTGMFNKFQARTTAFAGRRKIICSSQPNKTGSEWETICNKGQIFEWHWKCPCCNTVQPFHWSKEKENGRFAGFNWDDIFDADGETVNIDKTASTTWLECEKCDHMVHDTPTERYNLNASGSYVCIKRDGDSSVHTYTCPNFVNVNLSFKYAAVQYMLAKRAKRLTGLDEQMEIFVTQILGRFHKQQAQLDISRILMESYPKEVDKEWLPILSVDCQRSGDIKYWVCRAFNKKGNESRRLGYGVARSFEEIEEIRKKYNVPIPLVGIDSGDGMTSLQVYQACIKFGQVIKIGGQLAYSSWTPYKGDGSKTSYKHLDGNMRYYSPTSNQDCQFPQGSKFKGIPAPLVLWSNYSIKTILANLRDNKIVGVKWLVDERDPIYETHMYSENLVDALNKKTGQVEKRWMQSNGDNHYFDCEAQALVTAIRVNAFSATKVDEDVVQKIINNEHNKTNENSNNKTDLPAS